MKNYVGDGVYDIPKDFAKPKGDVEIAVPYETSIRRDFIVRRIEEYGIIGQTSKKPHKH